MPLSEAEIEKLMADVGEPDADGERAWARTVRAELQGQRLRLRAEARMWKFVRDDAKLTAVAKELARVTTCLGYLDGVIGDAP